MTPHSEDLDVVQRWMMSVITHPSGIADGIDSSTARQEIDIRAEEIEKVIPRSQACTSLERLAVYGNAYYSRLIECLESEFPAFHHAVGEETFASFAFGYLQDFPSQSYTLSQLGRAFPEHLTATRPPRETPGETPEWPDFLIDLAQLERIYSEVFDGPGEERIPLLTAETLRTIPTEKWGEIRLETSASLHLVQFRFPVQDYITAVRKEDSPEVPEPSPTWLVVNRREFVVRRRSVSETQWLLLRELQNRKPLGVAIEVALQTTQVPVEELVKELGNWFRDWTAAGYFRSIISSVV